MLEKRESKKKSMHVVEKLLGATDKAVYEAGDKLPPEQVIAEQTGVSRPSVREALGALRFAGSSKPGGRWNLREAHDVEQRRCFTGAVSYSVHSGAG